MSSKSVAGTVAIVLFLTLSLAVSGLAGTFAEFVSHEISLTLDVPNHRAAIVDRGRVALEPGWSLFYLGIDTEIESLSIDGKQVEYVSAAVPDLTTLPEAVTGNLPADFDTSLVARLVAFEFDRAAAVDFEINYSGTFFQDVGNVRFSNERVGNEVTATILERGAYLSPGAYYYPSGREELAEFKLTATIPAEWESVSDGDLLSNDSTDVGKTQSWQNSFASDGVYFFAAPFMVNTMDVDGIVAACYFFPEDAGLINNYLSATADYIRMYSELIGPYPYTRFTVVENFFPTGYGMPGWTLLGQRVLRLPFIIRTSLGHEVLHNWWGNSVFVDYESGNWCEGLTVYGADYRYKLLQSPEEARDYRKNILKQYVSYVSDGNDFPLRDFRSRTSAQTRTIGYNKAMMVFHMIEEVIGTDAFFSAWKTIYAEKKGAKVSWEDWMAAFEKSSGQNLSHVLPEWIDRKGAPVLAVNVLENKAEAGKGQRKVKFSLSDESAQKYRLKVPVRFAGEEFLLDTSVVLDKNEKDFSFTVSDAATTLEIDPDYHLFRRLYDEEVEPVISAILGNPEKIFVSYSTLDTANQLFRSFGFNVTEDSVVLAPPAMLEDTSLESYAVLFNPEVLPEYLQKMVTVTRDSIIIAGDGYRRLGNTFVLTGQDLGSIDRYMVIISQDYPNLPRLGQLIPHYGKYSYLVFSGSRNVGKGQWEPEYTPLKVQLAEAPAGQ